MFLGLPDPDPLIRGMDPDSDPSIIMQKYLNSKKNFDSFYFVTFFDVLSLKNVHSKSNKQKIFCWHLEG
jgi:hypothetical protein